jgi:hypothetical protein
MPNVRTLAILALGLAVAAPALADAPPGDEAVVMRDFFSGAWEVDVPAGDWSAKYFLAPDHTYRETGSDGAVRGKWVLEEGKICTTPDNGPAAPDRLPRYCNKGAGKHAGEQWTDVDPVTGNTVFFTLKAGR